MARKSLSCSISCSIGVLTKQGVAQALAMKGHEHADNSREPDHSLKENAPHSLKGYWDELETVLQAAGSGLAPHH